MPKATLNTCAKCGKDFLAGERGINNYCPHCNGNETFFLADIGVGLLDEDRLFYDHDAGKIGNYERVKAWYINGVLEDRLTHISFNDWLTSDYYGIQELNVELLRKEVFPYLESIEELYDRVTDRTYLIGNWRDQDQADGIHEKAEILTWYYGKPEEEITNERLGKLKDLALDFISFDWD